MDATFERTGEEGILSFCMQTKTGNVIINTLMPPKSHTISRIGVVSRKIFLHDEVAAESDGVPCHKHRDTDSQGFSPTPLQRVFYQIMGQYQITGKSGNIIK